MRIFRKHRRVKRAVRDDGSIGSALSSQDQFDIVVFRKPGDQYSTDGDKRTKSSSIMSYFTSDYGDDSTVSSLSIEEYRSKGGFYAFSDPSATASSWCCCSDTTLTQPNSIETNTVLQSYERDFDTAAPGGRGAASKSQRAALFANWRRSSSRNNHQQHSLHHQSHMSPSLFDALQEEDAYATNSSGILRSHHPRTRSHSVGARRSRGLFNIRRS